MLEVILKRFEEADEIRELENGKFEIVRFGGNDHRQAIYEPGWLRSEHVVPTAGDPLCAVEHLGMVFERTRDRRDAGRLGECSISVLIGWRLSAVF